MMNTLSQRGLADDSTEPRFLVIGRITKPHGVRGEVRVEVHTDDPRRFERLTRIFIGIDEPKPREIEQVRYHKSWVLLKLKDTDDRASAEGLRSQWIQIPEEEGLPLEEGQYYLYQIIGVDVFEEDGNHLGQISEVLETKANNVFVVNGRHGEILIPDITGVVRQTDLDERKMIVHLMPGLL